MDNLIEKIKEYVMEECRKYKQASEEHYDFWNEHIRYVYNYMFYNLYIVDK